MKADAETVDWILHGARWWLSCFHAGESIITPTADDFPVGEGLEGHELAEDYLELVKAHLGLTEWPFALVDAQSPNVAEAMKGMPHAMTGAVEGAEPQPLDEGDPLWIPYDAAQLVDPSDLIATIARGISHYLLYEAPTEPPGEAEDREYFVDLGAVFLGFGIFLANSAFRFQQTQEGMMIGWGYSRRGALSELDVSYVLALSAELLETPDRDVLRHLRPNPKSGRKHWRKKMKRELEKLREIRPPSDGPYR